LSTALHDLEDRVTGHDPLYKLVNDHSAPALALNASGQVVALNVGAAQLFELQSGDGLVSLGISPEAFHQFKERLANIQGPTLLKAYRKGVDENALPLILVGMYYQKLKTFVLNALQQHWPESIDLAFANVFGLSASERNILALLSRGCSSEEIAVERGSSVTTVRQQIKSLLQKLGAKSQVQAATMAASAATAMDTVKTRGDRLSPHYDDYPMSIHEVLRDQRRIGWRRFGKPGGKPVLFLHGPSFGAGDFPDERRFAAQFGLDVIAIERAGYGRTEPSDRAEDPLESQCEDIRVVLQSLALTEVTILSHEVALIPALALAKQGAIRVDGIVSISAAPPFRELEQINAMPAHQAIFIQAARHAPWLARLMIRLLILRMRKLGPEHWPKVIFEGVEPDDHIIRRASLKQGVIAAYGFYVNQLGAGYLEDLSIMIRDWSHLLKDLDNPLYLLHGAKNQSTPADHLKIFHDINQAAHIKIYSHEGLTLAVSQPEQIYKTLRTIIETRQQVISDSSTVQDCQTGAFDDALPTNSPQQ
jgi:pimeloyl-ACP methyl ester carboxylesterase/DNA-binding CsgD family transcriptional regulator